MRVLGRHYIFPLVILAVALCVLGSAATAHSRIDTTEPQDGAVLARGPTEAVLNFAKTIRLTKVELTHMDREPIELDLGEQQSFADEFTIPVPDMGNGTYGISWRGLSSDGHFIESRFSYRVD